MFKQLIINVNEHETRVALLEDGTIVELHVDRGDDSDIAGNIFKGRVLRVLPGMQAAFVDIGLNQAAFIYVDDVYQNNFKDIERFSQCDPRNPRFNRMRKFFPCHPEAGFPDRGTAVEGQEVLVQVAKSPMGTKGARISSHISIPGRFLS